MYVSVSVPASRTKLVNLIKTRVNYKALAVAHVD